MTEYLETIFDKFIFKVAVDRQYTREGLWVKAEGSLLRLGLSDFLQQRSGDVAFAEVRGRKGVRSPAVRRSPRSKQDHRHAHPFQLLSARAGGKGL